MSMKCISIYTWRWLPYVPSTALLDHLMRCPLQPASSRWRPCSMPRAMHWTIFCSWCTRQNAGNHWGETWMEGQWNTMNDLNTNMYHPMIFDGLGDIAWYIYIYSCGMSGSQKPAAKHLRLFPYYDWASPQEWYIFHEVSGYMWNGKKLDPMSIFGGRVISLFHRFLMVLVYPLRLDDAHYGTDDPPMGQWIMGHMLHEGYIPHGLKHLVNGGKECSPPNHGIIGFGASSLGFIVAKLVYFGPIFGMYYTVVWGIMTAVAVPKFAVSMFAGTLN